MFLFNHDRDNNLVYVIPLNPMKEIKSFKITLQLRQ